MNIQPASAAYIADPKIASLPAEFVKKIADPARPADFPQMRLRFRNDRWAASAGLDHLSDADWRDHFGRFKPLPANMTQPLALAYHGHQFRYYNPEIGDGRGFLYAQLRDHTGRLMDLGTKGSGTTRYSRSGDGRLTLKGGVREILAAEMLEALGVETSKTFSLIETGEDLERGDEPSPARSAVLVRLSHSHIRIGSFQRLAFLQDAEMMQRLVDYCMTFLYDEAGETHDPAALLHCAVDKIADQAAAFMVAGFVHGVLNSDNINITGESFDYGPWRFTPYWNPRFTAAYFDDMGLYAFGRQAEAMHWNLAQLAIALRLICPAEPLIEALDRFSALYQGHLLRRFLWRLGLAPQGGEQDRRLVAAGERMMIDRQIPIDVFFHEHRGGKFTARPAAGEAEMAFLSAIAGYRAAGTSGAYWAEEAPCTMAIEEVEAIWGAIAENDDWSPLFAKLAAIRRLGTALRE